MPESRDTVIEVDGRRLAACIVHPTEVQPEASGPLFVHGMRSSQAAYRSRAQSVTEQTGATCLTFDLGGHGARSGEFGELSPRQHLAEVCAAYDRLQAQPQVAGGRIGVCGASYGAYLSALLVAHRPVARLLLRAPVIHDDRNIDVPLGRRESRPEPLQASTLFEALQQLRGEALILESEFDEVVLHSVIETYAAHVPRAQTCVLAGATHAIAPHLEQKLVNVIVKWFSQL